MISCALFLSVDMMAQTVDFTGITVNTERVTKKKVYERKSFVMVDGAFLVQGPTGLVGARYGQVWLLGFYVGGEVGINGPIPVGGSRSGVSDNDLTGKTRTPAWMIDAGLIIRLSRVVNLYVGPTLLGYEKQYETRDGEWSVRDSSNGPGLGGELGVVLHFGRVTLMPGVFAGSITRFRPTTKYDYSPVSTPYSGLKLGVGFNF